MAPDRCASALGGAAPLAGGHRSSGAGNGSNAGAISARTMAGNRGARGVLHRVPVDCRFKYCITRRHLYGSCGADSVSGLFIGLTLALTAALLQFSDWYGFGAVAVIYGIGQLLESYFLTPYLVGERIGLHPLAVIFA